MRGRMPYPIPFLPMMFVVILISAIFPTLLKFCSRHEKIQDSHVPFLPKETTNQEMLSVDPFSDMLDVTARALRADEVRITTKYVEIGSGTEDLGFDWIVPFDQSAPEE